ncbi:RAD55 family ATPase [Vulgatibacter sp.]|uniref:RAD55 family ATPase n=1 Tax=Vulgatibacter sp. TaxID=1971226 RepID=UPI0035689D2B
MIEESELPPLLQRIPTGVRGLDGILGGGLFQAGIYILAGRPGAGKTTIANQMCFDHVRGGGRALYVTLLAETHGRMMAQLRQMSFFDMQAVGGPVKYINGFSAVESRGLAGLLELVRNGIREHRATLLVLDGMVTASNFANSTVDYKRFINELQTWVGVIGCTVLFLTSAGGAPGEQPEHTMVDGIIELRNSTFGLRTLRELSVTKFRGSAFTEGGHPYRITSDGVVVFPRLEGYISPPPPFDPGRQELRPFGVSRFDTMLGGGVGSGSTTLLLGSSGSGKTILGLHFLAEGARRGEKGLHFGFYEMPGPLMDKADRIGLGFRAHVEAGRIVLHWQVAAERILDALASELLDLVRTHGIKRLFIDGLVGFKETVYADRLAGFFSVLVKELSCLGVTTVITEETRELFVREIEIPTSGVSAIFDNIVFMRQVEIGSELHRLISVMKTRDSAHDRGLFAFDITGSGIEVGEKFPGPLAILGQARDPNAPDPANGAP